MSQYRPEETKNKRKSSWLQKIPKPAVHPHRYPRACTGLQNGRKYKNDVPKNVVSYLSYTQSNRPVLAK